MRFTTIAVFLVSSLLTGCASTPPPEPPLAPVAHRPPPDDCDMSFEPANTEVAERITPAGTKPLAPNKVDRSKERVKAADVRASN